MTEQQIETTLQQAIEHAAPDRLDAILPAAAPRTPHHPPPPAAKSAAAASFPG